MNKSEEYIEKYCKKCIEWPYNHGKDCDPKIPCPINNIALDDDYNEKDYREIYGDDDFESEL